MGHLQHTSYRFSFVDVMFQVDALFDVVQSAMGDRKVPDTEEAGAALHMLGALHWLYNALKLFCITLLGNFGGFGVFFLDKIHHPGAHFQLLASAWRFEMIENGSHLTRKWRIRVGIKSNATTGQLVKMWTLIGCGTTDISDTKKGTSATSCWWIWCPHTRMVLKINNFFFFFLSTANYGQNIVVGSSA